MERSTSASFLAKHGLETGGETNEFDEIGQMLRHAIEELGEEVTDATFEEIAAAYLAHFGVKGMRWGIRKDRSTGKPKESTGPKGPTPGKPGEGGAMRRTVTGPDGKQHPLSKDGELVFNAALKLQDGGFGTLSNAEIKAYTERIRLEDELVKTLTPPAAPSPGPATSRAPASKPGVPKRVAQFVSKTLQKEAGNQASRVLNLVATQQINKQLSARGVEIPKKKK